MTAPDASGAIPPAPSRTLLQRTPDLLVWGGLIILLAIAFGPAELNKLPLLFANSANMQELARGFLSPDPSNLGLYIAKMWQTIQMAIWGTFLAILTAIPLSLLASRNITPWFIQWPIRRVLDIVRSIPDLVIGMIFLVAVGPGPLAGVMALAIGTSGVLAKLFSEAVESIDKGPVARDRLGRNPPGGAALDQLCALPLRIQQPQRHGAGSHRRRRHRSAAVRQPERLRLLRYGDDRHRHHRGGDRNRHA
jgi:phosphonate transport system permease protein